MDDIEAVQRRGQDADERNDAAIVPSRASGNAVRAPSKAQQQSLTASITLPARRLRQRLTVVPAKPQKVGAVLEGQVVVAFPKVAQKRSYAGWIWFLVGFVAPVAVASFYYVFIASDQYVVEFRFNVRDASSTTAPSPSAGGLQSLLGTVAMTNDNYLVTDYLTSRQVVEELQERINLINLYSKPEADWWARYDVKKPFEDFVTYWGKVATARYDMVSGIATAQVRAFSPQDALLIGQTMVKLSEELVNRIGTRSANDAITFASATVEKAQQRLLNAQTQMTEYRNKFGIIDPTKSVAASNAMLTLQQRQNLAQLETQLATLQSQNLSPGAPMILSLQSQIRSTREQIERTEADVAKGRYGTALSTVIGDFEKLSLEVQFSQAMVTTTMASLEVARSNAAAQHLYITPYVRPSLPHSSTYPNRPFAILTVAAIAFAFWLIGLLIGRAIHERFR